jgi:hypothetical protein
MSTTLRCLRSMKRRGQSYLVACASLIVLLCAASQARAELWAFTIQFTDGPLTGNQYVGVFATDTGPPGLWLPEGSPLYGGAHDTLTYLHIQVDGWDFMLANDADYPDLPRIGAASDNGGGIFDYIGHAFNKRLEIFTLNDYHTVHFGDLYQPPESYGDLIDVHSLDIPPGPDEEGVPPEDSEELDRLAPAQGRLEATAAFRYFGFRRPSGRTSRLASCSDWEWSEITYYGVRRCTSGCLCGSAGSNDPQSQRAVVYDFDARKFRKIADVQFDERAR